MINVVFFLHFSRYHLSMSCLHPVLAFDTGLKTDKGKRLILRCSAKEILHGELVSAETIERRLKRPLGTIVFNTDYYKFIEGHYYAYKTVYQPCGNCIGCRLDNSLEWSLRCCLEASYYDHNYFVTFTYDDEHFPKDGKVHKEEFQRLMKRIRKRFGSDIRFFACGEYGSHTLRPHYHAILFNIELNNLIPYKVSSSGNQLYISPELFDCWKNGFVIVGDCNFQTCAYVARYTAKKVVQSDDYKPFLLMSRRPGIGQRFFVDHPEILEYDKIYFNVDGRPSHSMPKYFDYLAEKVKDMTDVKNKRILISDKMENLRFSLKTFHSYVDYLENNELILNSKIERLHRDL